MAVPGSLISYEFTIHLPCRCTNKTCKVSCSRGKISHCWHWAINVKGPFYRCGEGEQEQVSGYLPLGDALERSIVAPPIWKQIGLITQLPSVYWKKNFFVWMLLQMLQSKSMTSNNKRLQKTDMVKDPIKTNTEYLFSRQITLKVKKNLCLQFLNKNSPII